MDIKDIQELIKFVAKSGATEVDLEIDNVKISIKSPAMKAGKVIEPVIGSAQETIMTAPVHQPILKIEDSEEDKSKNIENEKDDSNYLTIKSPMIGTFYRKPSPEKETFANIGDVIKPGDVLCVIEAMKLFNEIEAEISGKIIKVLVEDASPVEYDQPLFLIDPS